MDWVHCNQCFYRPGQQPKKELILTSCGHILCKCCERSVQVERCKVCNASCSTTSLSSQMPENVRVYFEDPESALERIVKVNEFQKSHRLRLTEYFKTLWEKYQKLKFAYQKLDEENKQLKKEIEVYRKRLMTPPPSSHNTPQFSRNCHESPFIIMQSQEKRRPSSPFFVTPTRPASSTQTYRHRNTPSTPMSDSSNSPGSVTSQQSYRSAVSGRSNSQQMMYRPGLTPPLNRLSLLSVSTERNRTLKVPKEPDLQDTENTTPVCINKKKLTGVYSNTVVLQHHSVVMTKADNIYKVKCTYDMSSKNITFGMMPIRDPEMISITSAPEAPPPRIRILDTRQREVETVRIGDKLTFRIEIPEDTPYGIFARSCVAMAKDSKSTFQIIDDEGCPVDPSIFPAFTPDGNALQSVYEAFRFTESYGVIFQCNVKYCLGPCEPAVCEWGRESVESWGRRKRAVNTSDSENSEEDMTLSQEILVLDFGDSEKTSQFLKSDEPLYAEFDKDKTVTIMEPCPTKTSVLTLGVTCALLIVIYITTIFSYYMKKWMTPRKMMA